MPRLHHSLAALAVSLLLFSGCDVNVDVQVGKKKTKSTVTRTLPTGASAVPGTSGTRTTTKTAASSASAGEIRIATFNIQVFGKTKAKNAKVMDVLAQVVRRYDVIAIQEVRTKDTTVIPRFVDLVNSTGKQYAYEIGPRLGRTSSKEQYLFIYDQATIELVPGSVYTAQDPGDKMHREPLVARFRARLPAGSAQPFSFTLVNIHTDPDETKQELNALDDVFRRVQQNGSGEDDVIILGDLNVNHKKLGELGRIPNMRWTVTSEMTNTRRTKSYDNILFDRVATSEFTGKSGVLDLHSEFGLSAKDALRVSDHLPVWATFRATEGGPVRVSRTR